MAIILFVISVYLLVNLVMYSIDCTHTYSYIIPINKYTDTNMYAVIVAPLNIDFDLTKT